MKAEWTNRDVLSIESTGQKAILVIDVPTECGWGCPCYRDSVYSDGFCSAICKNVSYDDSKYPSDCPLKPMPEPRSETIGDDTPDAEAHGWNACIEELEK